MESYQLKTNSICSLLKQIDQYLMKSGERKVNLIRFEVGSEPNLYNFKLVNAFDRILRTGLCDRLDDITDEFLEKAKLMINKLN